LTNFDQFRLISDQFSSVPTDFRPIPDQFSSVPTDFRPILISFDRFQTSSDQFQTNSDQFQTNSHQFRPISDQFRPIPDQFRPIPDQELELELVGIGIGASLNFYKKIDFNHKFCDLFLHGSMDWQISPLNCLFNFFEKLLRKQPSVTSLAVCVPSLLSDLQTRLSIKRYIL
jgi:hypothetical protein